MANPPEDISRFMDDLKTWLVRPGQPLSHPPDTKGPALFSAPAPPDLGIRRLCRVAHRIAGNDDFGLYEGIILFSIGFLLGPTGRGTLYFMLGLLAYELMLYLFGRVGYGSEYTWLGWIRLRVVILYWTGSFLGRWWWKHTWKRPC